MSTLGDPKKMAQLGFEEGIGFIPFAGMGWKAIKEVRKDDSSPVRAASARVLAEDPDPGIPIKLATKAGLSGQQLWKRLPSVAILLPLARRSFTSWMRRT